MAMGTRGFDTPDVSINEQFAHVPVKLPTKPALPRSDRFAVYEILPLTHPITSRSSNAASTSTCLSAPSQPQGAKGTEAPSLHPQETRRSRRALSSVRPLVVVTKAGWAGGSSVGLSRCFPILLHVAMTTAPHDFIFRCALFLDQKLFLRIPVFEIVLAFPPLIGSPTG
ncbi:hypothetical protein BKA81DRAFT_373135 [Phyllosticta paracitricarpa]